MIYLILSIFFNAILFVIVKLFAKYKIEALQALVVNYFVAFLVGVSFLPNSYHSIKFNEFSNESWFIGSVLLGLIFIGTFYVTALTSQQNGLSVASVASKMSVIIPIICGIVLYNEILNFIKIAGIILALIAVYFSSKKEIGEIQKKKDLIFPALVFIGAGTIDSSLKFLQTYHVSSEKVTLFSCITFLCAFIVGIILITIQFLRKKIKLEARNIIAGIILGLPNYFSLYYLVKMLEAKAFQSATLFTIHNISIVIITTLVGLLFFKEQFSKRNAFGITLAIVAIVLVTI
ncbi:DMT family transporter [uncultured Flavobacterium sp.]|uniref:DMT family transporter n=1 Tax=uncultured Flavobacterium sp. TaxID=165435 RepID=UPI0030CA286D